MGEDQRSPSRPVFYVFPAWTNRLRAVLVVGALAGIILTCVLVWGGFSPSTLAVGYAPEQPIPYSHRLHVGELGLDCRYCHNTVETAAKAALPPVSTCMNCHNSVKTESELLEPLRRAAQEGTSVRWVRVHDLPEFVYFNHSVHLTAGVSCVSCHGRVDRMDVVRQEKPLTMGWCLDCHRDPEAQLRPRERITDLGWQPSEDPAVVGAELAKIHGIVPSTDCSTCHR
ncbi:MAG: cytochrome c3 family protein [Acidobacteriota bacterium]|nr:cytochrome c3 family protein [Acidobacteriota bacterium]